SCRSSGGLRKETRVPTKEVLVLEDELKWQGLLKELLEKAGYSVKTASSLTEAVQALKVGNTKVAVVDLSLGPGDGKDRQGREFIEPLRIPVVCVSGYLRPGEISEMGTKTRAKWFFDKGEFAKERAAFLEAIALALLASEAEISARWREIERRLR